jgi:peptide/nickel transport system ATP-binding protein
MGVSRDSAAAPAPAARPPLLQVKSLRLETEGRPAAPRVLLHDLSFEARAGEFLAIVGESGSGKTLAARAILGLLPVGVRRSGGAIVLEGEDLAAMDARALRRVRGSRIGMVFQEPMVSLNPALTVGRQLAEGLRLHSGGDRREIRARCLEMLARVRIEDPERALRSYPHEFSGGMRQRIMLASALLPRPRLLIADEPTTALDTLTQREVLDLIAALARDEGIATLLITHDLGLVSRYAERLVVLEKGRFIEEGATRDVLTRPSHPYTRRLVEDSRPAGAQSPGGPPETAPVLLFLEGVCVVHGGPPSLFRAARPRPVLHDIDLTLRAGEIMAVVGASGCGKTTLGRAVLGLKTLSAGRVRFEDMTLGAMSGGQLRRFRSQAQLIFQDPFSSLDPRMRIEDIVAAPLRHDRALAPGVRRERVAQVLREVSLDGLGERLPHQMSGGQRQRVAIARAIVSRPRLVVADEPVSALDVTIQAQILELLLRLQAQYAFACLFITHDLAVVDRIADSVVVMSAGRIVERGATARVLAEPHHPYTRALIAATPFLPGDTSRRQGAAAS